MTGDTVKKQNECSRYDTRLEKIKYLQNVIEQYENLLHRELEKPHVVKQMELFGGTDGVLMFVPFEKRDAVENVLTGYEGGAK